MKDWLSQNARLYRTAATNLATYHDSYCTFERLPKRDGSHRGTTRFDIEAYLIHHDQTDATAKFDLLVEMLGNHAADPKGLRLRIGSNWRE